MLTGKPQSEPGEGAYPIGTHIVTVSYDRHCARSDKDNRNNRFGDPRAPREFRGQILELPNCFETHLPAGGPGPRAGDRRGRITGMSKRTGFILFFLLTAAFLVLNRAAYRGYFQDDEIGSLAWTRWGATSAYLQGTLTPIYANSFRAVGFYYFHVSEHAFGLDFPKYVAVIHAFHLLTVFLLWLVMRRLGAPLVAAGAGCVFFALHAALFEAVWKPMFVFDLLCGTLCLASLLLWARGNWILSLLSFWLAYKAKELAVMLPLVLVCYELWFGSRRWMRLAPFLAVSLSFAVQALLLHPLQGGDYSFHFTAAAFAMTAPFYAGEVFLTPYLGFLLPLSALAAKNRRTWFGLAMMGLFFFPLLWLPGRIFSAYCYLPFTGLAIAMAGVAETVRPAAIAVFFLFWLPLDIHWLNLQRDVTLRQDGDAREWITTLGKFAQTGPPAGGFVYSGLPEGFHTWGMEGAVKYFYRILDVTIPVIDSPEAGQRLRSGRVAILNWDAAGHRLEIRTP